MAELTEFSSNVSDADEQDKSSSSDEDTSTTAGNEIDVEEVKRKAFNMDLSIALADEQARRAASQHAERSMEGSFLLG